MTAAQRRERDFWLGCAEKAYEAMFDYTLFPFLCPATKHEPANYVERLDLFRPDADVYAWWSDSTGSNEDVGEHGPAHGRVLAACFLAAMAELGDL